LVYLYNPALKSCLTRKFAKPWIGPCKITMKISELNYEIVDSKGKRQVVHFNRLKQSFNPEFWNPKPRQKPVRNVPRKVAKPQRANGNSQDDDRIGPYPLVCPQNSEARTEHETLGVHSPALLTSPNSLPIRRLQTETILVISPQTRLSLDANSRLPGHTLRSRRCARRPYLRMLNTNNMYANGMRIGMLQGAYCLSC
jgi:hypothetical protein